MTAEFALSLSHEGIDLLHRAADGWRRVGRADVASPDLGDDLAAIRAKAMEIAPDGFVTKIVVPRDQIRFLTLDLPAATEADVNAALEGATPYSLADLQIDHVSHNGKTQIAAVARETLREAEVFAAGHGFRPAAFVAVPPDGTFPQEVFFGPTTIQQDLLGHDANISRAAEPAVVTGTRLKLAATASNSVATPLPKSESQRKAAVPPYYDRVIAEVHHRPATPPPLAPAPIAPPLLVAAPPAPVTAAGPTLTPPERRRAAPATRKGAGLKIAAGIGFVALIGAAVFALAQARPATDVGAGSPTMVVEEETVTAEAPPPALPQGPDIAPVPMPLSAPVRQDSPLPLLATTEKPLPTLTPASRPPADMAPETLPRLPLAPPPPPPSAADRLRADIAGRVPTPDEARRFYEATGVWLRAPRFFVMPSIAEALDFVPPARTATDRMSRAAPAFIPAETPEVVFGAPANPPPPDAVFAQDAQGFVIATPDGAVTPEGAVVFAGLPDIAVSPRPAWSAEVLARITAGTPAPEGVVIAQEPPSIVPVTRPEALVQDGTAESATADAGSDAPTPGGVGLGALALQNSGNLSLDSSVVEQAGADDLRPRLRPQGLAPVGPEDTDDLTDVLEGVVSAGATLRFDSSTALAVATSIRPSGRPAGFGERVASTLAQRAAERLVAAAAATEVPQQSVAQAPDVPQSTAPLPGGVARAATFEDAIRLREINLIGVYGRSNDRRALVRLSNGRYVRVEVGSELDGGEVVAIGDDALNYVKRGRTYAIGLPDS